MKLDNETHLEVTLKNNEKILGNLFLKNLEKSWNCRVPTRTGKPGKMGRHFPVREKSGNFEQTGKVRENHTKYRKT